MEVGHKLIIQKSFEEILRAQSQTGWRNVESLHEKPIKIVSPSVSVVDEVSENKNPSSSISLIPSVADGLDDGRIRIEYIKDSDRDVVTVRISTVMLFSVQKVADFMRDLKRTKEWNLKFHKGHRVASVDENSDVVHMVFKSFSSPYKYRDFVCLRSVTKIENGGMVLVARSVLHPNGPEEKGNVRAVLFPSGYILTPLEPVKGLPLCPMKDRCVLRDAAHMSRYSHKVGLQEATERCLFTFVAQLDREGVLILSSDLLGESNELAESINNIKECLRMDAAKEQAKET